MSMILCSYALADQIKVAVIDTGYSGQFATPLLRTSLCKTGHYDFTTDSANLGFDTIGHGTFVSNLIVDTAEVKDVCILVYKVIDGFSEPRRDVVARAIAKAVKAGAKAVNISLSISEYSDLERRVVVGATRKGLKIFTSAGNEGRDLNRVCSSYPVCYKGINRNMFIVGATDASGLPEMYSNSGIKIDIYEYGSILNVGRGTSFSSPRALGKYLKERYGKN